VDLYVGAASTVGGMVALLAVPLDVMADAPALDVLVASRPGPVDCAVLAEAERLLVHSADSEAQGRGWVMHAANVLYNVATGLVLGLFFGRWSSAVFTAVSGTLLGEVTILTQPTGAEDALRLYREGHLRPGEVATRPGWHLGVAWGAGGLGVGLRGAF
jgi:hypothetical protein